MDFIVHKCKIPMCSSQALNANYTSDAVNIQSFSLYAIQFVWSGYTTGTVTIYTEASNDGTNFTVVDSFIISTDPTSYILNVEKAGYEQVRIRVAQTSGTGTLTATLNGK